MNKREKNAVFRRTFFEVPIYNVAIHIALNDADDDVLRERFNIPPRDWVGGSCADCRHTDTGERRVCIYVKPRDDRAAWMVSASHEAIHAAYYILDVVGIRHDVTNHEALCYLHDVILGEMITRYGEQLKRDGTL